VALGGTALAATGTLVNIADGTNAGNVAKVDGTGALRTLQTEGAPAKPFSISQVFQDVAFVTDNVVIPVNTTTLGVSRIYISNWSGSSTRRTVILYQYAVPNGGSCGPGGNNRIVGVYQIGPGADARDEPNTPMVLKPLPGLPAWCLSAQSYPNATENVNSYITVSGFIAAGSLPAGVSLRPAGRTGSRQPG
jgi:hypothetical protein